MNFTLAPAIAALGLAALTGCSAAAPAAAPSATASSEAAPSETPETAVTEEMAAEVSIAAEAAPDYADVDSLREAFVAAGGTCKDFFKPQLVSALPLESGICGTDSGAAQMYMFYSQDKRDQYIANVQAVSPAAKLPVHLVVGDLWTIDSPQAAKVADAIGGTLLTK